MKKPIGAHISINENSPKYNDNVVTLSGVKNEPFKASEETEGLCSVVIVSYKTGEILLDCIRSVFEQNRLHQLILVDNGNSKQTVQLLNKIADNEPKFEIITGHGNVGFSSGCNLGVSRARGQYILLLNPDTILQSNTLEPAINVFHTHPNT